MDNRQLSRDGRIRNPDEKPLVAVEAPAPTEPEILPKPNVKQPKGDSKSASQKDNLPTQKVQKEASSKEVKKRAEHTDIADKEIPVVEKPAPEKKVDEAKLKEMKREEEIAKAKQAMERKKKLADKAAAKAAIRAQKEAEKKLKEIIYIIDLSFLCSTGYYSGLRLIWLFLGWYQEREKKAKKKAAANAPEELAEEVPEAEEPENADANGSTPVEAPTPAKPKVNKENTLKHRTRSRGPESLPKAILKRKKSTNYWVYAAPVALVVLLSLIIAYYYLLWRESCWQFSA